MLNRFSCMIHTTHWDSQQKSELNSTSKIYEAVHLYRELHIHTHVSVIAPVTELWSPGRQIINEYFIYNAHAKVKKMYQIWAKIFDNFNKTKKYQQFNFLVSETHVHVSVFILSVRVCDETIILICNHSRIHKIHEFLYSGWQYLMVKGYL